MKNFVILLGRLFICAIFLASAGMKVMAWDATSAYMASKGMQQVPLFLAGAIVVELFGGLSILVGARARAGAMVLALYLIPVTILFHSFWTVTGGEMNLQLINFLKNCAIFGGLLLMVANGAGSISADQRRLRRREAEAVEEEK